MKRWKGRDHTETTSESRKWTSFVKSETTVLIPPTRYPFRLGMKTLKNRISNRPIGNENLYSQKTHPYTTQTEISFSLGTRHTSRTTHLTLNLKFVLDHTYHN